MIDRLRLLRLVAVLGALVSLTSPILALASQTSSRDDDTTTPIKHVITIMQENHSFDNYFGTYPGADGIPEGTCMPINLDDPGAGCIEPFHIGDLPIEDLDHSNETARTQLNGGRMDGFVHALELRNQDGSLAMGYYDDRDLPYYWNLADEYVLFDRFFSSAHGGSVWNHNYWVAGAPITERGTIPDEGFDAPTIFDRLEEAGISWKFYVQNYDPTLTYRTLAEGGPRSAQVIWVPLLSMARYIDDPDLFEHIVPLSEYFDDLANDTLPAVAYMVPSGASEHPPGSIRSGMRFVRSLIQALMRSDEWDKSMFLVTYDDWGGWYDHVEPPVVDRYGYGFRVPTFMASPYAKKGYIDSTVLDYTSIMKFIEENWRLEPVAERDANANSLTNAFDFNQPPRDPAFLGLDRSTVEKPRPRREVVYVAYTFAFGAAGLVMASAAGVTVFNRRKPGGLG